MPAKLEKPLVTTLGEFLPWMAELQSLDVKFEDVSVHQAAVALSRRERGFQIALAWWAGGPLV